MSVNFYDGLDAAEILLPRRAMKWLVRIAVVVLLLLLWSPLLDVDQVTVFLTEQGAARAHAVFDPIVEQLMDSLPQPPTPTGVTTTTALPTAVAPGA